MPTEYKQSELEQQLAEAFQTGGAEEANEPFEAVRAEITQAYEQWEELAESLG